MTSHSSQGQTADRVLIHVDTELASKDLLNSRMAYVSVSRGAHDARIFTDNREKLPTALGHDIFEANCPSASDQHRSDNCATAGNFQGPATGAHHRSWNRHLEHLPAPDNGSVARAQPLSRPTKVAAIAGTRLDRVCSTRAKISQPFGASSRWDRKPSPPNWGFSKGPGGTQRNAKENPSMPERNKLKRRANSIFEAYRRCVRERPVLTRDPNHDCIVFNDFSKT